MTQEPEGHLTNPVSPTATVARRIREVRTAKGWSATELAAAMKREGVGWDRSVVANLENGRRANVSVEELLTLAFVLDVAPVHLLVPIDGTPWYAATPETHTASARVREWVRGFQPLASTDPRMFFLQAPEAEWQGPKWTEEDIERGAAFRAHVRRTRPQPAEEDEA